MRNVQSAIMTMRAAQKHQVDNRSPKKRRRPQNVDVVVTEAGGGEAAVKSNDVFIRMLSNWHARTTETIHMKQMIERALRRRANRFIMVMNVLRFVQSMTAMVQASVESFNGGQDKTKLSDILLCIIVGSTTLRSSVGALMKNTHVEDEFEKTQQHIAELQKFSQMVSTCIYRDSSDHKKRQQNLDHIVQRRQELIDMRAFDTMNSVDASLCFNGEDINDIDETSLLRSTPPQLLIPSQPPSPPNVPQLTPLSQDGVVIDPLTTQGSQPPLPPSP